MKTPQYVQLGMVYINYDKFIGRNPKWVLKAGWKEIHYQGKPFMMYKVIKQVMCSGHKNYRIFKKMNMTYEFMYIKWFKQKILPLCDNGWEPQIQSSMGNETFLFCSSGIPAGNH